MITNRSWVITNRSWPKSNTGLQVCNEAHTCIVHHASVYDQINQVDELGWAAGILCLCLWCRVIIWGGWGHFSPCSHFYSLIWHVRSLKCHVRSLKWHVRSLKRHVRSLKWHVRSLKWQLRSLKWHVRSLKWHIRSLKWHVRSLKWHIRSLKWHVRSLKWHTYDPWNDTCDPWNDTCDPWNDMYDPSNATCDPWNDMYDPWDDTYDPWNDTYDPWNDTHVRSLKWHIRSLKWHVRPLKWCFSIDGSNQHGIWTAGDKSVLIQKRGGKSHVDTTLVLAIHPDTPFSSRVHSPQGVSPQEAHLGCESYCFFLSFFLTNSLDVKRITCIACVCMCVFVLWWNTPRAFDCCSIMLKWRSECDRSNNVMAFDKPWSLSAQVGSGW